MIGCLRTGVRKQPIIAFILSLRLYSSFITSRPGDCYSFLYRLDKEGNLQIQFLDMNRWKADIDLQVLSQVESCPVKR